MTTQTEALELALAKFKSMNHEDSIYAGEYNDEVNAIEEALAQPEQEPCKGKNCGSTNPKLHSAECFDEHEFTILNSKPFGYFEFVLDDGDGYWREIEDGGIDGKPLYTIPPKRKPLTDEQHSAMWDAIRELGHTTKDQTSEILEIVSDRLAAHGIKE